MRHPIELMIAPLAFSKPGKAFFNQATHTIMEIQKSNRATAEIIFVKNQTSLCTVVSLNLVSPDMATIRPMMVLSPVAKTTPVHFPWMTKVELSARLRVSITLSEVDITVPGIISLSKMRKNKIKIIWSNNQPFTSEKRTIETQIRRCFDDANICRDTIALGIWLSIIMVELKDKTHER